jgi:hypothetical protein
MRAIKAHGGVGLVQDPKSALHRGMPESAIAYASPERFRDQPRTSGHFTEKADDLEQHTVTLRGIVDGVASAAVIPLTATKQ